MTPNNRSLLAVLALAGSAVLLPSRADATLMKAATFDEKVDNAAAIVVGTCLKTEARWDPTHRWILTYSTFRVDKSIKGAASGDITLVTPGGHVGDLYQDTIGVPEFREGKENVIFVKNSNAGPTVLYFDQGAYEVTRDGNERIVVPVESDAVQIDTQRGVAVAAEAPVSLSMFEGKVRSSERRMAMNRMELIRRQQHPPQASVLSTIIRYKFIFAAAVIGLALATIQMFRK